MEPAARAADAQQAPRRRGRYSKQRRKRSGRRPAPVRRPPAADEPPTPTQEGERQQEGQRQPVRLAHSCGATITTTGRILHTTATPRPCPAPAPAPERDRTATVATLVPALRRQPIAALYPALTEECVAVLHRWKGRFDGRVWTRMTKHGTDRTPRCVKEFNECAPVVEAVRKQVAVLSAGDSDGGAEPVTIVDLCSGFGFLGSQPQPPSSPPAS